MTYFYENIYFELIFHLLNQFSRVVFHVKTTNAIVCQRTRVGCSPTLIPEVSKARLGSMYTAKDSAYKSTLMTPPLLSVPGIFPYPWMTDTFLQIGYRNSICVNRVFFCIKKNPTTSRLLARRGKMSIN